MHSLWTFVGLSAIVALIIVVQLRARTQHSARFLAVSAFLLLLCLFVVSDDTGWHLPALGWYALGALAGAVVGWRRGKATSVRLGGTPGTFIVQGSWVTIALIILTLAAKTVVKLTLRGQPGLAAAELTGALLMVTIFNLLVWHVVVWRHYTVLTHESLQSV